VSLITLKPTNLINENLSLNAKHCEAMFGWLGGDEVYVNSIWGSLNFSHLKPNNILNICSGG